MAEFDNNQSAIQYGESLLASRENERKKQRKRKKRIDRVNIALAGVSIADSFLTRNARKKVSTFTNNLNAEKAHELSNYKQASAFNEELDKYKTLNPAIDFNDPLQYDERGLIYDAIKTKHAKDTRSQYARGFQNSFANVEGKTDAGAISNWEKEVKRRTANSMISLKAAYNKHKGYLNTTDVAIESQYKQILDQGTNNLMSPDNTSSIRKLFNKFGITEQNNSNLTNIEAGGVKMQVNEDMAIKFNEAIEKNTANEKTYNLWLEKKDKKYDTTATLMVTTDDEEKKQLATFSRFTKASTRWYQNVHPSKDGVLNKNVFAQAGSKTILKFQESNDSQGKQPLINMNLEGAKGVRTFSDLWGNISGDQKRVLTDNSEMLYGRVLKEEEEILKNNAPPEGLVGEATGSPEAGVDAMVNAIQATVSFNNETNKYVVRKLLQSEAFNAETGTGETIPTYKGEGHILNNGKITTDVAMSYYTNVYDNPTVPITKKITILNGLREKIKLEGDDRLEHFNEILKINEVNFDNPVESEDGLSNVIAPRDLFSGEFNQQYGLFPSIKNKWISQGSREQIQFYKDNPKLDTSLVDIAGLGSMFGGDGVQARDFLINAMEDALPTDESRLKAIEMSGYDDSKIELKDSEKKVKLIDKKGHITWNGSQFNQEGTVAVPLLGAEGSGREMEYKDVPEGPLKELIKQKAVALYADNFRQGKRIIGVSEDGEQYLTNYGEGSILKENAPAWLVSNSFRKDMQEKKNLVDNTIRTGRTENVSKLINLHITAKNNDGTPRFLITNEEKSINNLLNKFLPAVIEIESDGDPKAKSSISSASGLLQFLMPSEEYPKGSAIPALNRLEKYLGPREWGPELREHGDASLLTAEQQVELFIGNTLEKTVVIRDLDADGNIQYNKKGKILTKEMPGLGDTLMQKVFDGDMEGMLEAYYKIHHTAPDRDTIKRAEKIFKQYF